MLPQIVKSNTGIVIADATTNINQIYTGYCSETSSLYQYRPIVGEEYGRTPSGIILAR